MSQMVLNDCKNRIKKSYEILIRETENKRIMDIRMERILEESLIWIVWNEKKRE